MKRGRLVRGKIILYSMCLSVGAMHNEDSDSTASSFASVEQVAPAAGAAQVMPNAEAAAAIERAREARERATAHRAAIERAEAERVAAERDEAELEREEHVARGRAEAAVARRAARSRSIEAHRVAEERAEAESREAAERATADRAATARRIEANERLRMAELIEIARRRRSNDRYNRALSILCGQESNGRTLPDLRVTDSGVRFYGVLQDRASIFCLAGMSDHD